MVQERQVALEPMGWRRSKRKVSRRAAMSASAKMLPTMNYIQEARMDCWLAAGEGDAFYSALREARDQFLSDLLVSHAQALADRGDEAMGAVKVAPLVDLDQRLAGAAIGGRTEVARGRLSSRGHASRRHRLAFLCVCRGRLSISVCLVL